LGWFWLTQHHLTHFYEVNFQQVSHQNNGRKKETHSGILCKGGIISTRVKMSSPRASRVANKAIFDGISDL
jgi:hypothetical protein